MTQNESKTQVLCPLRYEAAALMRRLPGAEFNVACIGPGSRAVEAWFAKHAASDADPAKHPPLILAGLAGAITSQCAPGCAYIVERVVSDDGQVVATAPRHLVAADGDAVTVTSVDHSVRTPAERIALHDRSGADLVDMESIAFARRGESSGATWLIVRGVSDGIDDVLPEGIEKWVDERGAIQVRAVVQGTVAHPRAIRSLIRLNAHGRAAMAAAADRIIRVAHELRPV